MKKNVCRLLSIVCLLGIPATALADTSIESTTIFRAFQDSRNGFPKKDLAPVTQFLSIDADKLADGNLSLHFNGWGRVDLADKSFNNDQADGNLTYGYLQYDFDQANAQVKAGRFNVNQGIGNESVDGVYARTDLRGGFSVAAYRESNDRRYRHRSSLRGLGGCLFSRRAGRGCGRWPTVAGDKRGEHLLLHLGPVVEILLRDFGK